LTLLSGSELLYLLQRHGYKAKIDLTEAKNVKSTAVSNLRRNVPQSSELDLIGELAVVVRVGLIGPESPPASGQVPDRP
jgi:hypothetical protein